MSGSLIPRWLLAATLVAVSALNLTTARPTRASITPQGQQGCTAGTVVGGPNLVQNGDFSQGAVGFTSQLPDRGVGDGTGIYPDDEGGGGFSIQTGEKVYNEGRIVGRPFPGDPQREVPSTETYFYSNPNRDQNGRPLYGPGTAGRAMLWRQEVPVTENTTYNFFAYFDNLLLPTLGPNNIDPQIELQVNGIAAGPPIIVQKQPDFWLPIQFSFTTGAGQTTAVLEIYDLANSVAGDDFGMTQINLKQCVTSVGAAKFAQEVVDNGDGSFTVEYLFTLRNLGVDPLPLTELQLIDDLTKTFANAGSFNVVGLNSSTLTVNPTFNGASDQRLLTGEDTLPAGATATVTLRVRFTPGTGALGRGPFFNSATVTARAGTVPVSDATAPGLDPDPNGDGDPREPGEDAPTVISIGGSQLSLPLLRR